MRVPREKVTCCCVQREELLSASRVRIRVVFDITVLRERSVIEVGVFASNAVVVGAIEIVPSNRVDELTMRSAVHGGVGCLDCLGVACPDFLPKHRSIGLVSTNGIASVARRASGTDIDLCAIRRWTQRENLLVFGVLGCPRWIERSGCGVEACQEGHCLARNNVEVASHPKVVTRELDVENRAIGCAEPCGIDRASHRIKLCEAWRGHTANRCEVPSNPH